MKDNKIFRINVREIIRSKAPKLYKKIPGFAITLLSKLICEDQLNDCIRAGENLTGVAFMESMIRYFNLTLKLKGTENLPDAGHQCIFASNHPLGGMDGICLSAVIGKQYDGHVRYLVNDILYFLEPLQDIFVPINKHGAQAKNAVAILNESFASENQIITFPAGLCSRKTKGVIHDPRWKKMFISKAIEYQRDVVPVYFEAQNSNFFYNIANIRTKLGLKFNLEMLLLPREMLKKKNAAFTIYFGKPVSWQTFDSSQTPQQWADKMESRIYNIRNPQYTF
jgi:putative hemolysin